MITRIEGVLEAVEGGRAVLRCGPLGVEVLVPAAFAPDLSMRIGGPVTLFTIALLESHGQGSSFSPRLLGFPDERERAFFELFTTVKGIGPRKAMRALARPSSAIATAIVEADIAALSGLPEIGKRTAQTIVAELAGKVDDFALGGVPAGAAPVRPVAAVEVGGLTGAARDAAAVLEQLGESAASARDLVERAIALAPELDDAAAIIEAAYRPRDVSVTG